LLEAESTIITLQGKLEMERMRFQNLDTSVSLLKKQHAITVADLKSRLYKPEVKDTSKPRARRPSECSIISDEVEITGVEMPDEETHDEKTHDEETEIYTASKIDSG